MENSLITKKASEYLLYPTPDTQSRIVRAINHNLHFDLGRHSGYLVDSMGWLNLGRLHEVAPENLNRTEILKGIELFCVNMKEVMPLRMMTPSELDYWTQRQREEKRETPDWAKDLPQAASVGNFMRLTALDELFQEN